MNLKNLKNKASRYLPEIIGVTVVVAVATAIGVAAAKMLTTPSLATAALTDDTIYDIDMIKETLESAAEASMIHVTEGSIIFLSK